jgi:ribonuclease E
MSKILINAVDPEECRIAMVKESQLVEFYIESASRVITQGNIYKGIVARIEPSLQAAFVDYGAARHGFLQKNEVHSDYFQDNLAPNRPIKQLITRGQELLVQVTKDPVKNKGAMLTTFLSLPGRYLVLMPGSEQRGVSRKIEDPGERQRLREILDSIKIPEGFGLIVRTAGKKCSKTVISKDLQYLMRLWGSIKKNVMKVQAPFEMYKERSIVERSLRDSFTSDISEILIDNESVYREAKRFMNVISPKYAKVVKLYKGAKPIFNKHGLENQIASIYNPTVRLKSGGSIVIEQTEAMVSVDVNSGKATREDSIEKTALQTNLEASEELALQLRLRDMGGLIVIDFIDMRDAKHRREVENHFKTQLKLDKAKTKVGRISRFGLLEITRQRLRPSIDFGGYDACPHCQGKGLIPSTETSGIRFLRELSLETVKPETAEAKCSVPPAVANFLLNRKRRELVELEERRHVKISINPDPALMPGESRIELSKG